MPDVRAFNRSDRDQLLSLVNHHVAACLPGGSIPAAALLSQLERDSSEYITEPWVIARHTVVAIDNDRLVAAAHLKRYADDARVSASYSNAATIEWFVFLPDHADAGTALLEASLDHLRSWRPRVLYADGGAFALATYGVPDAWPHVAPALEAAGFSDTEGRAEIIMAGHIDAVPAPGEPPLEALTARRVIGPLGVAFEACLDGEVVGVFEAQDDYTRGGSVMTLAGWADEANHWVRDDLRCRGIGTWLFRLGCDWLRLGNATRLLAYATESPELPRIEAYYARHGLHRIGRTRRGWKRDPY